MKIAWVRLGQCTTCLKESKAVSTPPKKRWVKKHKHEKHHKHKTDRHSTDSMDYDDPPPNLIPKLIVKFGSENTPERSDSPAAPVLEQNEVVYSGESFGHHHRHK